MTSLPPAGPVGRWADRKSVVAAAQPAPAAEGGLVAETDGGVEPGEPVARRQLNDVSRKALDELSVPMSPSLAAVAEGGALGAAVGSQLVSTLTSPASGHSPLTLPA